MNRPRVANAEGVGINESVSRSLDLGNGTTSQVSVGWGEAYMPVLKGAVTSADQQRVGSNVVGYRTYTYNGSESIDLALSANLHFIGSGDLLPNEAAGEGQIWATLFVTKTDIFDSLTGASTADQVFMCAFSCGTRLATGEASSFGLAAGEHDVPILLQTVRLNPGDQFVVGATMQMFGNRGGQIDALNTFMVEVDTDRTFIAGTQTRLDPELLLRSISAVPEPSTWAMLIAGFGMSGAMLRSRRRGLAVA